MAQVPVTHILHCGYTNATLRSWQSCNTSIQANNLMYPLFIVDDPDAEQEIGGMPGIYRFGVDRLENHLKPAVEAGLSSVLLFGVPYNLPKDDYPYETPSLGKSVRHSYACAILEMQSLKMAKLAQACYEYEY